MVSSNVLFQIEEKLVQSKGVLVLAHDYPDGDAVGSVVAMCNYLSSIGKVFFVYYNNLEEEQWAEFSLINKDKRVTLEQIADINADVVCVLDSSNVDRLGPVKETLSGFKTVINIDHHGDNSLFGDINLVEQSAATGEVLYNIFEELGWSVDSDTAVALLIAIISDSGRFQYINTHPRLFKIVMNLVEICGMEAYFQVVQNLYEQVSLQKLQLFSEIIRNVEFYNKVVAFSFIEEDAGLTEGLIEQIRAIKGVKVAVLARKVGDLIKMSFRSKDKDCSVRELASKFGGGGHPGAAGASMPLVDYEKQIVEIQNIIKEYAESL